ncbi:L-seryl-tRNA(Sec) selenium transferase [Nonomuraea rosea]|uniref:L-seryl-tRNA(Sec) selenium transferase n=1 Tax=Nonomuraea rosea TaxID=638574 RepID=A0ABP6Z891_9ACTN
MPRTDVMLADSQLAAAQEKLGRGLVKAAVASAQQRVREGLADPDDAVDAALALLPATASGLKGVVNATGVLLHTNLGRAPLSAAAVAAVSAAAGYTDVEFDLVDGQRARRGRTALAALAQAVPEAGAVHVVNNNAAALVLATTVLAAGKEIVISRGELVEIGDGFRLPELLESARCRLREVGTTNRTTLRDYQNACGPDTGFILKVHPSNYRIEGFTSEVSIDELATIGPPVVADIGSGLLRPEPLLPGEPDVAGALRRGAALVTASGDKLLGGPQAGLLLGDEDLVERLRRHPLARALRVDKLTLAALEATLRGPRPTLHRSLHASVGELRGRAERLARRLGSRAEAVPTIARVGGGGAPGVELPSAGIAVDENLAARLRSYDPPVIGRITGGRLVLDLRAVEPDQDEVIAAAVEHSCR